MLTGTSRFVRTEFKALEPGEILTKSVDCLLGVTELGKQALGKLGIATVFDLASSQTFATANWILDAANGVSTGFARYGRVPGELVDDAAQTTELIDLPLKSLDVLRHIGPTLRQTLESALDIGTIRDFALWPPYHAARAILSKAYGLESAPDADPDAPPDLIPASGQYPTERVQYEVLLFDQFVGGRSAGELGKGGKGSTGKGGAPTPQILGSDGPLDMSALLADIEGYDRPAIGGVLTFTQSWYTRGLSLGHLIHGIALAPGESTKIAVIDWSRTVRTSAAETIEEGEQLVSELSRARSINEITSAVARETQQGQSAAQSFSAATQSGTSTGSAGFRDPSPLDFIIPLSSPGVQTSGTSSGTSTGLTNATSWSTSSGQREVGASLAQDIVDRTHQASHSARNRRASIVREVSQTESESISTRTLTNYNHMHALTVEYYEVVQLYRTIVELSKADRCLFVPMKLIDFRNVSLIDRYRALLWAAALAPAVREALEYPTGTTRVRAPAVSTSNLPVPSASATPSPLDDLSRDGWTAKDIREAQIATGGVTRVLPDGRLVLPSDAVLWDIDFVASDNAVKPVELVIGKIDGTSVRLTYGPSGWVMAGNRVRIDDIAALAMTASGVTGSDKIGFLSIIFQFKSKSFRIVCPVKLEANVILQVFYAATVPADVLSHLQDNRLYYSQAIWRALDPATIGILLSGYTWSMGGQAKPLVELVDPTPVALVANYLVLRISGDDAKEHAAWLDKKKIKVGSRREDQVPIPSGGVFAEAVLGRFNSAEKLDITRFWNWQDSPIPIQAPDIAAIQAGSRRDPDNTTPGQLSAPVLNIINPPSLPDPQGMGAVLAAIQNGNMFRDMSGLSATIGLAQAGLAGAQQGASDASAQAGKNAAVAAELGAKVAEIAAKLVAAYFTGGAGLAGGIGGGGQSSILDSAQGVSKAGSILNYARDMDGRGVPSQDSTGTGSTGTETAPSSSSGTDGLGTTSSAATSAPAAGNEGAAFSATLGGRPGGVPAQLLNSILGAAPLASTAKAWPKLDRTTVLTRLNDLKANANLFNQGNIGLCTAAAFYHHVIQKDPLQFFAFASGLYGQGIGFLGKLKMAPGDDLRNADYNALGKKFNSLPPQADWMLMSALRDSESWFFDFEGAPNEKVAMNTSAGEMSDWYRSTGFYSSVDYSSDKSLAKIKTIQKKATNHIALWVAIKLLGDPRDGTHMITLESPMMIDEVNNKVTFNYWTWGQPVKTLDTTVDALNAHYLGVITATF